MKVFLSYPSAQAELAARIAYSLKDEGDAVFFDRESLPPGETYDFRIRAAIEGADVFVFLVTPESVAFGSYALAELGMAERIASDAPLKFLPIMVAKTDFGAMPPYLRSITVLQPRGDVVAETVAALADIRRELTRQPVTLSAMPTNSGWIVNFHIMDEHVREILYRIGAEGDFRSTGFSQIPDRRTGLPQPRLYTAVPDFSDRRNLEIKYIDSKGRERGPFVLTINANEQLVAHVKQVLDMTRPWVAFSESQGRVYLLFTHLLSYKNAFREIQYSVDDDTLSSRVRFTQDWSGLATPGIGEGDEVMIEVSADIRYVCVKLIFSDVSEWPAEWFHRK